MVELTGSANPKVTDWAMEAAKGNIPGTSTVLIRGHNPDLDNGVEEDVWEAGADLVYLTTGETMNIASTDTNDKDGGAGVRTVLVSGLNDSHEIISEVITTDSAAVATTGAYLRVNTLTSLTVGATGWNVGNITAVASTAGTMQCEMDATEGISQNSHYTVAAGYRFFVGLAEFNSAKISGGGSPEIEFKVYARPGGAGASWLQLFDKKMDTGVTDEIDVTVPIRTAIPAKTDIRVRAVSDTNNTEVRTRVLGWLVAD